MSRLTDAEDWLVTFDHLLDIDWLSEDAADLAIRKKEDELSAEEHDAFTWFMVTYWAHQRDLDDPEYEGHHGVPCYDYDRPPFRVGRIW